MVVLNDEPDSTQYYFGECDSLLANCCSRPHIRPTFKFRMMNRQRRQMAFEMLRQMKLQEKTQQSENISSTSKRRRNRKRFYRALCCTELHISESQSSVFSPTMTTMKSKIRPPAMGLTNELYFASHKPDGDNEKTPPVLLRNRHRSPYVNIVSTDTTQSIINNRRPISSPVRSTTYVLQQHHRINNSQNNITNKKRSSPVHQHHPSSSAATTTTTATVTSMTLNKTRQIQQQRIYSNHERLLTQTSSTIDSPATNQHSNSRAHTALTPRHTSPIVRNTSITTTSRSPRIPNITPTRCARPIIPVATTPVQARSPRGQVRPSNLIAVSQRTISSSPTTNKTIRPQPISSSSKSPVQLRSITGVLTRPSPNQSVVNKSKMTSTNPINNNNNNIKIRTPAIIQTKTTTPTRVSDLDALLAEKTQNHSKMTPKVEPKPTIITPSPIANNIRRSLFSTDTVKIVRPVRSQELKLFSCHLNIENSPNAFDDISHTSNTNETSSTLTPTSSEHEPNNDESNEKINDLPLGNSTVSRDLSEDSLNEHYHIKQLLKSNVSVTATNNDSKHIASSIEDVNVTTWSNVRSSCESNISEIAPLPSEMSTSPACYNGPIRDEDIHMANDGRYFLLIDDNLTSEDSQLSKMSSSPTSSNQSIKSLVRTPLERRSHLHRLVYPQRLGRILFYRRTLSDSDIYQKLCSKDNEIQHNVYHLDTIRDYSMEFYMLTTYGSDSQLRAWLNNSYDDYLNETCYFDDNRFQSFDDDDDDDDEKKSNGSNSSSSITRDDINRLHADEELDWYSELESFNISSNNQQWKNENGSSCSSEDHVGELLRAEQFSVSSLTTTTSADSSNSTGLISSSWPLTNSTHYQIHSNRSSQSLTSPPSSSVDDQSQSVLKDILTYPWTKKISDANINCQEIENDPKISSVIPDEFQPDFYYLCPLKNTTSFIKTDEKSNGIHGPISHDA